MGPLLYPVYPRCRGELQMTRVVTNKLNGLSPLARGTLVIPQSTTKYWRFIPAGAGNSGPPCSHLPNFPVYPRWRGELDRLLQRHSLPLGLSPLARGTLIRYQWAPLYWRFIPAGAGNSHRKAWREIARPVYPRWRGELCVNVSRRACANGLSPLARGTRSQYWAVFLSNRFIPAGAGNSRPRNGKRLFAAVYPRWRGELSKHNLLLINDFLSQSQSTNFTVSHKQHIHYVKEHLIHWLKR